MPCIPGTFDRVLRKKQANLGNFALFIVENYPPNLYLGYFNDLAINEGVSEGWWSGGTSN
jgi:hypothetical protein